MLNIPAQSNDSLGTVGQTGSDHNPLVAADPGHGTGCCAVDDRILRRGRCVGRRTGRFSDR